MAPTASAASCSPSSTRCGLRARAGRRSLPLAGSPSAPLPTTTTADLLAAATVRHLRRRGEARAAAPRQARQRPGSAAAGRVHRGAGPVRAGAGGRPGHRGRPWPEAPWEADRPGEPAGPSFDRASSRSSRLPGVTSCRRRACSARSAVRVSGARSVTGNAVPALIRHSTARGPDQGAGAGQDRRPGAGAHVGAGADTRAARATGQASVGQPRWTARQSAQR